MRRTIAYNLLPNDRFRVLNPHGKPVGPRMRFLGRLLNDNLVARAQLPDGTCIDVRGSACVHKIKGAST